MFRIQPCGQSQRQVGKLHENVYFLMGAGSWGMRDAVGADAPRRRGVPKALATPLRPFEKVVSSPQTSLTSTSSDNLLFSKFHNPTIFWFALRRAASSSFQRFRHRAELLRGRPGCAKRGAKSNGSRTRCMAAKEL